MEIKRRVLRTTNGAGVTVESASLSQTPENPCFIAFSGSVNRLKSPKERVPVSPQGQLTPLTNSNVHQEDADSRMSLLHPMSPKGRTVLLQTIYTVFGTAG